MIVESYELRAILEKDGTFAILALSVTPGITVLGQFSDAGKIRAVCQSPIVGRNLFDSSVATSRENGWGVMWHGSPPNES